MLPDVAHADAGDNFVPVPPSLLSIARASSLEAGFPRIWLPMTTMVSAPMTRPDAYFIDTFKAFSPAARTA